MDIKILDFSEPNTIADVRTTIDNIDCAFLHLLSERMRVIAKIGIFKVKNKLSYVYSEKRVQDLENTYTLASGLKLDSELMKLIFRRIYEDAVGIMETIEEGKNSLSLEEHNFELNLEDLKENLYNLDNSFCYLLIERFRQVKRIGRYKNRHNIKLYAPKRWEEVLKTKTTLAQKLGLNTTMVRDIFTLIHDQALSIEGKL